MGTPSEEPPRIGRLRVLIALVFAVALVASLADRVMEGRVPPEPADAPEATLSEVPGPAPIPPVAEVAPVAEAAPASARVQELVVLGPDGRPLPGVRVRRFRKPGEWLETDAAGRVTVPFLAGNPSTEVRLSGPVPEDVVRLEGPETLVRYPRLLPLDVEVVDGETGESIGGADVFLRPRHGPALALEAHGARFDLPVAPVRPGERIRLSFAVEGPNGRVLGSPGRFTASGTVSAFATRVEVTIPLYREALVTVLVREEDGSPIPGAQVDSVKLGPVAWSVLAETTGPDGRSRIRGIPALRGESLVVTAEKDRRSAASAPVRLPRSAAPVTAEVVLPPAASERRLRARATARATVRVSEPFWSTDVPEGTGRLQVRVLRADGKPAAGVTVFARFGLSPDSDRWPEVKFLELAREMRTDEEGWARFGGLPDAKVWIRVTSAGFLAPPPALVAVRDGSVVRATIREEAGSAAVVTVLDGDGLPLPFARIEVADRGGVAYAYLAGTTQRLALFTDAGGRIVLPDLPDKAVEITARYGSRKTIGTVARGAPLTLTLR